MFVSLVRKSTNRMILYFQTFRDYIKLILVSYTFKDQNKLLLYKVSFINASTCTPSF